MYAYVCMYVCMYEVYVCMHVCIYGYVGTWKDTAVDRVLIDTAFLLRREISALCQYSRPSVIN